MLADRYCKVLGILEVLPVLPVALRWTAQPRQINYGLDTFDYQQGILVKLFRRYWQIPFDAIFFRRYLDH